MYVAKALTMNQVVEKEPLGHMNVISSPGLAVIVWLYIAQIQQAQRDKNNNTVDVNSRKHHYTTKDTI